MSATLVRPDPPIESDPRPKLSDRLSRRTSTGRYMPEVDGVRFLAIGIVVAVHVFAVAGLSSGRLVIVPPFGPIIARSSQDPRLVTFLQYGHVGVYLFFILSGFVLALPFIRWRVTGAKPVVMSSYFLRRLTRIEPPFVVVVVILFLVSIALHERSTLDHLVATVAYSHQAVYGQLSPLDGVFWSLEAEVQWYLIVPFLALLLCRGSPRERLLAIALAFVGTLVVQVWLGAGLLSRVALLDNLQFFLIGWLLADIHVTRLQERPRNSWFLDVVGIACLPLFFVALRLHSPSWRVTLPILGGVAIGAALHGRVFTRAMSMRWVAVIGGMCYSIYLLHYPILVTGAKVLRGSAVMRSYWRWPVYAGLLLSALALSAAFFVIIERPCMDPSWVDRLKRALSVRIRGRYRSFRSPRRPRVDLERQ
jgi:peptidoglycan/LPS O-acetylase OafA/YrhL